MAAFLEPRKSRNQKTHQVPPGTRYHLATSTFMWKCDIRERGIRKESKQEHNIPSVCVCGGGGYRRKSRNWSLNLKNPIEDRIDISTLELAEQPDNRRTGDIGWRPSDSPPPPTPTAGVAVTDPSQENNRSRTIWSDYIFNVAHNNADLIIYKTMK